MNIDKLLYRVNIFYKRAGLVVVSQEGFEDEVESLDIESASVLSEEDLSRGNSLLVAKVEDILNREGATYGAIISVGDLSNISSILGRKLLSGNIISIDGKRGKFSILFGIEQKVDSIDSYYFMHRGLLENLEGDIVNKLEYLSDEKDFIEQVRRQLFSNFGDMIKSKIKLRGI